MKTQTILTPSGDRLVILPEADFEALLEAAEDASDARAVDAFRRQLAVGDEELIPSSVVDRLLDGDNPIKVWRDYRGMTSQVLAEKAGIGQGFLSQIETGKRSGTIDTLAKIAAALDVTIDDVAAEPLNVKIEKLIRSATNGISFDEIVARSNASPRHSKNVCDWLLSENKAEKRGDIYYWTASS